MSSSRGAPVIREVAYSYELWDDGPAPRPWAVPWWRRLLVRKQSVASVYGTYT